MRRYVVLSSFLSAALALGACASDETESSGPPPADFSWQGGEFTVTAHGVADGCLDGAAEVVAIPGIASDANATREFKNPLPFPGRSEVPKAVTIQFVAPFSAAEATVTSPKAFELTWSPKPTNKGVDLGALSDAWKGCVADFEFGSTWTAEKTGDGDVKFAGKAEFTVTSTNGDAGCPAFEAGPPCTVTLDVIATRKK